MVAFIGLVVFLFVLVKLLGGGLSWNDMLVKGTPARGILLSVANKARPAFITGAKVERRAVRIDVEILGQAPYEISTDVDYPTNLRGDVLPGATVELRVDPKNPARIVIVGPGVGFAYAANAPPPLPAPTQSPRSA